MPSKSSNFCYVNDSEFEEYENKEETQIIETIINLITKRIKIEEKEYFSEKDNFELENIENKLYELGWY
jgi:hypothetical protein